jgi:hypothetical protein
MRRIFIASLFLGCLFAGAVEVFARGPVYVERYTTSSPIPKATYTSSGNSTAQGVAEMMARSGACQHFGNPTGGYEGVGMGGSPEAALGNCCYSRSGMRVVDQGVACGRNGRWYACKRYR